LLGFDCISAVDLVDSAADSSADSAVLSARYLYLFIVLALLR